MPATGQPGYLALVKRGGTSTAMTNEVMNSVGAPDPANTYQITDAARRIIDRAILPTFRENGTPIPEADIVKRDFLFGKVTFTRSVTEPIDVSGNYIPTVNIGGANSYNLNMGGDLLDDTDFEEGQTTNQRSRVYGLRDVSVSFSRFEILEQFFHDAIADRTPVVIDIRPSGAGDFARGWCVAENEARAGDSGSLEQTDPTFQLDGSNDTIGKDAIAFSWGQ